MTDLDAVIAGLSEARWHILMHSLGVTYGRTEMYRNHFVTGEGSDDYADCRALVDVGLMTRQKGGELTGGDDVFFVTDAGKRAVRERLMEKNNAG